jgi:sarcosine/dimethylglycine N-methyltransferase
VRGIDGGRQIKSMPLYGDLQRIDNELAALGVGPDEPLRADQLYPFDQLHYHGTDAVRAAAGTIGLGRNSRVLEIGSGLGGPARYLAQTVGCHVTALELQQDLHDLAASLTRRCELESRVDHVRGDALTAPLPERAFDAVVSWLAIHHIPRRPQLMERLARALTSSGRLYIEDLVQRAPFSPDDAAAVRRTLYGVTITSADSFAADVAAAGFREMEIVDMTPSWAPFCRKRADAFTANRERHVRVHGEEIAARLEGLGGIRLAAQR